MLDYRAVCAWLNRQGLLAQLCIANSRRYSADATRALVAEILGPKSIVRIKRTSRSWAYPHNGSVTLSCGRDRSVRLSIILHECAHIIDYRKGKRFGDSSHGEPLRRTYARLLREYTASHLSGGNSAPTSER